MGPIIAGFIDTPEGQAAARFGAAEARLRGTGLVVATHLEMSGTGRPGPEQEDRSRRAEASLDRIAKQLATDGLDVTTELLRTTHDGGSALAQLAEDRGAALLVIGIRGRSRVGKLLLGSNANQALLHAPCDVLCVRAHERRPRA